MLISLNSFSILPFFFNTYSASCSFKFTCPLSVCLFFRARLCALSTCCSASAPYTDRIHSNSFFDQAAQILSQQCILCTPLLVFRIHPRSASPLQRICISHNIFPSCIHVSSELSTVNKEISMNSVCTSTVECREKHETQAKKTAENGNRQLCSLVEDT